MEKICIVGSGNWGSCIAKIIGHNVALLANGSEEGCARWGESPVVNMWVFEETVKLENGNDAKLSEVINSLHENIKYLPGVKLPTCVRAVPDLKEAASDATLLVFVLPHQFVARACSQLLNVVGPGVRAISLIKGLDLGGLKLVSSGIKETLGIDVAVLMGANLANDVARERFSEATLGGSNLANLVVWKQLLQTQYFRITAIQDASGVELCGALKNIVATAAGFIDGMFPNGGGDNTKAAIIRRGLAEMRDFCRLIDPSVQDGTFLESCGIADIVTSSYGGRNRRVAEAFVVANGSKSIDVLEAEMLGGMKLQGPPTAQVVYEWLHQHGMLARFPILTGVYYICYEGKSVSSMLFCDPVSNL